MKKKFDFLQFLIENINTFVVTVLFNFKPRNLFVK